MNPVLAGRHLETSKAKERKNELVRRSTHLFFKKNSKDFGGHVTSSENVCEKLTKLLKKTLTFCPEHNAKRR